MTDPPDSLKIAAVSQPAPNILTTSKRTLVAWLLLALLGHAASAIDYGKPLFQWRDAKGSIRYTPYPDEVPRSQRSTLERVKPLDGMARDGFVPPGGSGVPGRSGGGSTHPGDFDQEIAYLEVSIARDKAVLERLISDPETAQGTEDSADLAVIAERLPRQQAELEALLERRKRNTGGDGR